MDTDARIEALEREVTRLRDWRHDFSDGLLTEMRLTLATLKAEVEPRSKGEDRQITMRDVYVCVGGFGAGYALAYLVFR